MSTSNAINVTIWHEYRHERTHKVVAELYPQGMHQAIAEGLRQNDRGGEFIIRTATLDEPEHGLPPAVLDATDVLIWWGHAAHGEVRDDVVERVVKRVWDGMGLIVLHSGHFSKPFKRLMGTDCALRWREANDKERFWVVNPAHPIAQGLPDYFELESEEMYGEFFGVPQPDELVFISWFTGGEVFRSGCCWHRGMGKVFYFRPGHETYPTYFNPLVRQVIANGVRWAAPTRIAAFTRDVSRPSKPLEDLGVAELTKDPSLHGH
ncbi:MAG: ThuA domain-containing protein [Anaerolineae bacterium]|nr:ThuA domain-containing protein [Candidatus Roseilinea sp.]MDW8449871.1 ThuA domain-containing protein [Anaerolineae bacterium]